MKIILFIDSLTSGGAQRQLCSLARGLRSSGYDVHVLNYYPHNFFRHILSEEPVIEVTCLEWSGQLDRVRKIRGFLRQERPDVVVSFLETPNFLVEICRLAGAGRFRLIVSERNNDTVAPSAFRWISLLSHIFANRVVANSHVQEAFLAARAPWLKRKLRTITNCVDLTKFSVGAEFTENSQLSLNLAVVGRYESQKNGQNLVEALVRYEATRGELPPIEINWYGNDPNPESGLFSRMQSRIETAGVAELFHLNDVVDDVTAVYHASDALCLVSLHEGCANVVCEAMACGVPALVTPVGDNAYLVVHGLNGIVSASVDVADIVLALREFATLSLEDRRMMGLASRRRAEELLAKERFLKEWVEVIEK